MTQLVRQEALKEIGDTSSKSEDPSV